MANSLREMSQRSFYSSDVSSHEKLMSLLKSWHVVHVQNEKHFAEKLTWCLEFCQNKFRDIKASEGGMDWYFENEQDAMMFAMKWA